MMIPFAFLPPRLITSAAKKLVAVGNFMAAMIPTLKEELIQADIEVAPREWMSIALVTALSNSVIITALIVVIGFASRANILHYAALFGLIMLPTTFATVVYYPRIISTRKTRRLENYLIPAARQLLIELKSGVPLFQALVSISNDYGEVSKEFRKMVKRINSGVPELDALSDASRESPSFSFRKLLWQISNALKVGSDLGSALEAIIVDLEREQVDRIKKYGQELSPWTMIYMMFAVVLPSLGVSLFIVITSFLNIQLPDLTLPWGGSLPGTEVFLVGVVVFLIIFQLFFMNFVGSRRPMMV